MKKLILYFLLLFTAVFCFSQVPDIEWQNTIGGIDYDYLYSAVQTTDGGYILGGSSSSGISGDKTEITQGSDDYWIIKLDNLGAIQWQNTIGGGFIDNSPKIIQTADGGYIIGGSTQSGVGGDKTDGNQGGVDYWIIKLNSIGNIQWQNDIGGDANDWFSDIEQTIDGGYVVGGYSWSGVSGDKTENNNGLEFTYDYWVLKLNGVGNILWQNTIGGSDDDWLYSIDQTTDGGYVLGGKSLSNISGDKTENNLGVPFTTDYWVVKLDNLGNVEWDNTIGGSLSDILYCIHQTTDGGFILGGYSASSISGDKTEDVVVYGYDYWILKLNSLGEIQWQNTIGGSAFDYLTDVKETIDGGYIIVGYSPSPISGDKTEACLGDDDYWIVKLNSIGNILWQNTIGGNTFDYLYGINQTSDSGFILAGYSLSSISGDKTETNLGSTDYWVIKLSSDCTPTTFYVDADGDGYGNNLFAVSACDIPIGYVTNNLDCNDSNAAINPGAIEVCNDLDDNCNFLNDEGLPLNTYYLDADNDNYGNILFTINSCSDIPPLGYVTDSSDCDDSNILIHEPIIYYADFDGDLYGDVLSEYLFCSITPPLGYVADNADCNDLNILINPSEIEICNAIDDNCNDAIDEGLVVFKFFIDADNDYFGNPLIDTVSCLSEITGYVIDSTDCDDSNQDIYPGAIEILNGLDDDCDDLTDEGSVEVENIFHDDFEIYPNPNNGSFQISVNNQNFKQINITVADVLGNKIYSNIFYISPASDNKLFINLPNSFSGVADLYFNSDNYFYQYFIYVFK